MAPNFISRITLLSLSLALCFAALPVPARAASTTDASTLKEHVIKFYLDPALAADIQFVKNVLPKYVADMNTILAKNTVRRFVFDPETGIILTSTKPQTNSAPPPLPTAGFEIWVHVTKTVKPNSYGGYASMDKSGAGVLAGLFWTQIYDPENLTNSSLPDYSTQLNTMLHELAHIFGAGIGEYYNLANITDQTGMAPLLNISLNNAGDSFWSDKPDFMADPLLRITHAATRSDYLATVRYSNLTAAIMNGDYRNGVVSFDHFTVQVLDVNGQPLPEANVKVWNVIGNAPNLSELFFDGLTDQNGQVTLAWGGSTDPHNNNNFLRLIKVYKDGLSLAQPRYISIYDADIAQFVSQSAAYMVTFKAAANQPPVAAKADIFRSTGASDGWLLESSPTSNIGGSMNASADTFYIGDDAGGRAYRSVLSFDTNALPDNAVITKISFKIRLQGSAGSNPFGTHGKLLVDIRHGAYSNALPLQPIDFQANSNGTGIAQITNTPGAGNWYTTNLNTSAFAAINLAGATQFRLRFSLEDDKNKVADYLKFFSGNAEAASRPMLIVEYHLP